MRSECCNETISRPSPGMGRWTCDNCHGPANHAENPPQTKGRTMPESLANIADLDTRIEVMQNRLAIAVDYATAFRTADDAESVAACERAISLANMLSNAILATAVKVAR